MLETPVIKAVDYEQRIAIDVIYEPNKLDAHNQWASEETLRKACENFNKSLDEGIVTPNLFHLQALENESLEIIKTWINEVDCVIGDQEIPEGTWLCKMKYHDDELWDMKKSGELQGVSIGAKGFIKKPETT